MAYGELVDCTQAQTDLLKVPETRMRCCSCRLEPTDPQKTSCHHIYCKYCIEHLKQYAAAPISSRFARCLECGTAFTSVTPLFDLSPPETPCFTSRIVTITVGKNPAKDFFIHGEVIEKNSAFLKTALDKNLEDEDLFGEERLIIAMPEIEIAIFSQYATWLLHGKLGPKLDVSGEDMAAKKLALDIMLAKLYIFGEKLSDPRLCNAVIREFWDNAKTYSDASGGMGGPSDGVISTLYENTVSGSSFRRFLVDCWLAEHGEGWHFYKDQELHPQFARDLLNMLSGR